jgi:hypothetical protein
MFQFSEIFLRTVLTKWLPKKPVDNLLDKNWSFASRSRNACTRCV